MRILRTDQMDNHEAPEEAFRDDHLRELVDSLPKSQRHLVSRIYFGGATVTEAVTELGWVKLDRQGNMRPNTLRGKAELAKALEKLRRALQAED